MTRIFVQRGSSGSSSNPNRPPSSSLPPPSASSLPLPPPPAPASPKDEEQETEAHNAGSSQDNFGLQSGVLEQKPLRPDELPQHGAQSSGITIVSDEYLEKEKPCNNEVVKEFGGSTDFSAGTSHNAVAGAHPPPPPVPPPKPTGTDWSSSSRRTGNNTRGGALSRRPPVWPPRSLPSGSHSSSPRSYVDVEGYNSADEQGPCFMSSYDDTEREHLFEIEIRRVKGFEVRRMLEDGNCLFRAVADQVYGDSEAYDMARQMSIDYMERERDHFSQFITEGFMSYCKRKRRDKVYGNNVEIQAFSEMYNRPIHIYSYSTEPINIFHGSYNTDSPPIRLSYHHGNHYNSLVDPRRLTIGAGLGFNNLRGTNVDKDRVKAAIRDLQDQQIDNALLAEGRFYSDLELTEKEIERMVMEASRAEYLAEDKLKHLGFREPSTSRAEPSSSAGMKGLNDSESDQALEGPNGVLSHSMQILLSMGFSYLQVIEAYSIFGEDVDSMICYLLETDNNSTSHGGRRKGKAAE